MSWNYRILERTCKEGMVYSMHEAFYDEEGDTIPTLVTGEPVVLQSCNTAFLNEGETWQSEMKGDLLLIALAFDKSVLKYEDYIDED